MNESKFHGALDSEKPPKSGFSFVRDYDLMALPQHFYPKRGHVLLCDFSRGFVEPEMIKRRPVVVVSPSDTHSRRLCTVIPLSTTEPSPVKPWHYALKSNPNPLETSDVQVWAKCDMLYTVSFDRLDKFHRKTRTGREYMSPHMNIDEFQQIIQCISAYFALR